MSTVYVAPSINTNDAGRAAQAVADRAILDVVIVAIQAQEVVQATKQVAAALITSTSIVNETAAQKAKGKV
jgi:hypothetical protein